MLLTFRGYNARSFRDPFELSFFRRDSRSPEFRTEIEWREDGRPIGVLPSAGIFGANASGKSNLLRAMNDMRRLVLTSFRGNTPDGPIETHPFILGEDEGQAPTSFEVELVLDGIRHDYGFVVDPAECARSGLGAIHVDGPSPCCSEPATRSTSEPSNAPKDEPSWRFFGPTHSFSRRPPPSTIHSFCPSSSGSVAILPLPTL